MKKLVSRLFKRRKTTANILKQLYKAEKEGIIDSDALMIIEGVIELAELQARDVMIPRSQMITLKKDQGLQDILDTIRNSDHSRFPVEGDNQEEIIGVLLTKDLLHCDLKDFDLEKLLRPVVFVPESKRLNVLLQEFRKKQNHMAIVVDEYGGVAGLISIEDVIEQIVGDIEDEHDLDEEYHIKKHSDSEYILNGITTIEEFNTYFNTKFSDKDFETIAGLVTKECGYLPKRRDIIHIDKFEFTILRADKRRLHLLSMKILG